MCRWVAYLGDAIRPEELLYEPEHSLIHQTKSSELYDDGINADGFGIGWYGSLDTPGVYRSTSPAWSDRNLREICEQLESEIFLAHARAATGTPVQETNCHPFRYGRWVFVHNGYLEDFDKVRRELLLAVDPELFLNIQGSTDSELFFHLALTFGLEDEPFAALERAAGFIEDVGKRHGIDSPLQMTVGLSDGERLYAARYASQGDVNSLFVSTNIDAIRQLYPAHKRLQHLPSNARTIVSEPLARLPGAWVEVPVSTAVVVSPTGLTTQPFAPHAP